jgi:hypothetical protein
VHMGVDTEGVGAYPLHQFPVFVCILNILNSLTGLVVKGKCASVITREMTGDG